ncbi:MAG: hypothetical protein ACKVZ6_08395 [Kineosporiaceae bacterium]
MQLGAVLDTVIGIAFVFFLLALASAAVAEWLATVFKKRAKYLLRGLADIFGGQSGSVDGANRLEACAQSVRTERGLYQAAMRSVANPTRSTDRRLDRSTFLAHPLVAIQAPTVAGGRATRLPSYISARTFASVVLDAVVPAPDGTTSLTTLRERILAAGLPAPVEGVLLTATRTAASSLDDVRTELEHWYDATMEGVSGSYKRWVKRWLVVIATVLVLTLHVDTLHVARTLYTDPAVRAAAVTVAEGTRCEGDRAAVESCLDDARAALESAGLPFGPPQGCSWREPGTCLVGRPDGGAVGAGSAVLTLLGLALSVLAATFGAPFWFQLLTRAANLRNTGRRPEPGAGAAP